MEDATNNEICGWFVFNSGQVLIEKHTDGYHVPFGAQPPVPIPIGSTVHSIGTINNLPAKTYLIHTPVTGDESSPCMMKDLRASFDVLPLNEYKMAGKASQILNWDKNSRYCPSSYHTSLSHSQTLSGMPSGILSAYIACSHCTDKKRR